jgi:uncharacterized protein YjbI with pentapeptide repeats
MLHRLTGLLHPEWDLRLGPGGDAPARSRGERGVRLSGEARSGRVSGGAPVEEAVRCGYDGAQLIGTLLVGRCALSTLRGASLEGPRAEAGATLLSCDLEGASLEDGALEGLEAHGCSLREAALKHTRLGGLHLCDLYGADLVSVRFERALASDFTAARLVDCDLSGADLRGSVFRRAELRGCTLAGARVEGADFAGARGLSAEERRDLLARGARFRGAALTTALARLLPGADPLGLDRAAGAVRWGAIGGGLALALGAALLVMTPPRAPGAPAIPGALKRSATEAERERTQQALAVVRARLKQAHEVMEAGGAVNRSWPTISEFSENRFDLDGDGPGETYDRLFPDGVPENYLTESQGTVLPYCNDVPDQGTLSGVDADWHYCELTGRVFASAGHTGEATLEW